MSKNRRKRLIRDSLLGFIDLTVPIGVSSEVLEVLPVEKIQWLIGLTLTHVDNLREEKREVGSSLKIYLRSNLVEEYVMKCIAGIQDLETGTYRQYKMYFTEHNEIPYDGIFYIIDTWTSLDTAQRLILLETEEEYKHNYHKNMQLNI